jgi:hypothetical protein
MSKRITFTLEIESENAAFQDSPESEIGRILDVVKERVALTNGLEFVEISTYIYDANGNKVGTFYYDVETEDEDEDDE